MERHKELLNRLRQRYRLPRTLLAHGIQPPPLLVEGVIDSGTCVTGLVASLKDVKDLGERAISAGLNLRLHYADYIAPASVPIVERYLDKLIEIEDDNFLTEVCNEQVAKSKVIVANILEKHELNYRGFIRELKSVRNVNLMEKYMLQEEILERLMAFSKEAHEEACKKIAHVNHVKAEALDRLLAYELSSASPNDKSEALWIMKHQRPHDFSRIETGDEDSREERIHTIIKEMENNIHKYEEQRRLIGVKGNVFQYAKLMGLRQQVLAVFGRLHEETVKEKTSSAVLAAIRNFREGSKTVKGLCDILGSQARVIYHITHKRSLIGCLPYVELDDYYDGLAGRLDEEEDASDIYEDTDDDMAEVSEAEEDDNKSIDDDMPEVSEAEEDDNKSTKSNGSSQEDGSAEVEPSTRESSISSDSFISSDSDLVDMLFDPKPQEQKLHKSLEAPAAGAPAAKANVISVGANDACDVSILQTVGDTISVDKSMSNVAQENTPTVAMAKRLNGQRDMNQQQLREQKLDMSLEGGSLATAPAAGAPAAKANVISVGANDACDVFILQTGSSTISVDKSASNVAQENTPTVTMAKRLNAQRNMDHLQSEGHATSGDSDKPVID